MKYLFIFFAAMITGTIANGQNKKVALPTKFDVAVSFNSICCGPPSSDFLKDFVKKFNKENKLTLKTFIAAGCGREGEFSILFSLTGVKAKPKAKFMAAIKTLIPQQQAKNKTANTSSGNLESLYDVTPEEFSNCRSGITKWD